MSEEELTIDNPLLPERQEGETYEGYRLRRAYINKVLNARRKGILVWNSANKNTYVKPKKNDAERT